jgi:hypothetical protein
VKLQIRDYRSVERADIELSELVTLVGGPNHAGKSSVAQAVAALVSGKVPYELTRNTSPALVRVGTDAARLSLEHGTKKIEFHLPAQTNPSGDCPLKATVYALGIQNLLTVDTKDGKRAREWARYLNSEPTEKDLGDALGDHGIEPARVKEVWEDITKHGWDGAHKRAKEQGTGFKAQWEHVAGEGFKPAKGGQWLPANWADSLNATSEQALQAAIVQAKEELEAAVASNAVSQERIELLQQQAGTLEATMARVSELHAEYEKRSKEYQEANEAHAKMTYAPAETIANCWKCSEPNAIKDNALHKPDAKKKPRKEFDAEKARLKRQTEDAMKARDAAHSAHNVAKAEVDAARAAVIELDKIGDAPSEQIDLETARERVRIAEQQFEAWKKKTEADRLFTSYQRNQKIIDVLAPDGLRQRQMAKALEAVNNRLSELSHQAGWKPVAIDPALNASFGGRSYHLLSKSEQFRVNVVLQVWCAETDWSEILVVDEADILDRLGRQGLLQLLWGWRALVCMTVNTDKATGKPDMPDLASTNPPRGLSYWIDASGAVSRLGEVVGVG